MAGAGDEHRNDNDHSGSSVGLPPEQSDMQVDTPTLPNRSLPNDPDTGFRPPFLPIAPKGPNNADLDLLPRIPCLYRLLDLFSERGSNGSCKFIAEILPAPLDDFDIFSRSRESGH